MTDRYRQRMLVADDGGREERETVRRGGRISTALRYDNFLCGRKM